MADNTSQIVTDIPHAKVKAVAERVVQELRLAAEKVAAHHAEPARYPMPEDKGAAEHLLAQRFDRLPDDKKKRAADAVVADLKDVAGRGRRLGDLARVDLRSPASVDAQVQRMPFPERLRFPADELRKLPFLLPGEPQAGEGAAAAPSALHKLELRIHSVKCLAETSELGSDEISLAGTSVDESGDTLKISPFDVRSFDDGDVKTYAPPKQFHWFSLDEGGTTYPKPYFVTLVLAEVDFGGLAAYVDQLLDLVRTKVAAYLAAAVGGAIGVSGGVLGVLIGMAVGAAIGWAFDQLKGIVEDDVFTPVTLSTIIPALTARWNGKPETAAASADYRGFGGHYRVTYTWRMFN
ncbi:hypothetical protein [Streptomyces sp. NBC_00989]|uniref:hypothetical protein n=1 Tax=Streptomyces sp. NBC_00989 TaxID=2903705 RepID=UPI003863855B|nr:hypothetical protein OG714_02590 [Streptomyces sp. NBC_00989]